MGLEQNLTEFKWTIREALDQFLRNGAKLRSYFNSVFNTNHVGMPCCPAGFSSCLLLFTSVSLCLFRGLTDIHLVTDGHFEKNDNPYAERYFKTTYLEAKRSGLNRKRNVLALSWKFPSPIFFFLLAFKT